MATFHVGQRTHRQVLPQPAALESVSADNPGRDETGHRHPSDGAPGVEHGRGETRRTAPGGGRHPEASHDAEGGRGIPAAPQSHQLRSHQPRVFVLDRHGAPLQPARPAMARKLPASGRAVIHRHTPWSSG